MDYNYAREKLNLLLRDLDSYTDDEFWRQMSRIAAGATGEDHAEEIAKERDALVNRVDFLNQQNNAQQEQNDELAAHVEQMREAFLPGNDGTDGGRLLAIGYVLNQSPTTSLARLKAEWQAEALDEVVDMAEKTVLTIHPNVLRQWANRKRRQAEELVDD